uniref:Uncharacterized protein n=2 Tax=Panthera TaxID=9688 RepID=A0A8C8XXZ4_PANLE
MATAGLTYLAQLD